MFTEVEMSAGNWIVTPGMRWETIDLRRRDFSTDDPDRGDGPTRTRENTTDVLIPGVGAVYAVNSQFELLGGVSKGFNPPGPGSSADEEESINWEFGGRLRSAGWSAEVIGFYSDYDNLVGTCTESTGGGCDIGDQYDGGKATVAGLEASGGGQINSIFGWGIDMPIRLSYTWTPEAQFDSSFDSDFGPWGDVQDGDDIPYIPENQAQLAVGLAAARWRLDVIANYVDETRTEAGSGSIPNDEATDEYLIFDLAADYRFTDRFSAFTRIDNVLDETYIVARRPSGARPGKPQSAMLGFRYSF
jgi:Fe(3+) dicitrate transport protein